MNKIIKAIVFLAAGTILTAGTAEAMPHRGPGHRPHCPPPRHHMAPPVRHHMAPRIHHHGGHWGRGGRNFWPGFVGGVVGGALTHAIVEPVVPVVTPTVVQQPVIVQQPVVTQPVVVQQPVQEIRNVWVEGRYVDQVQANGSIVRVWQPGHYEQQTVVVQ